MKKNYLNYVLAFCFLAVVGLFFYISPTINPNQNTSDESKQKEFWSTKKSKVKSGQDSYMKPDGFIEYYNSISKRIDQSTSDYVSGYRYNELSKSLKNSAQARNANLEVEFISRGPGNVGGRTRAIAVDPDVADNCTWIAGAASGGLWKTTDCGDTWQNISPDLPNLSTNSIAQAASNPNVIYVGTGEVFAANTTFVRGEGIYKSTDRGTTWEFLPSTVENNDFISVNRIKVDPTNENIVVIATNEGIYKSIDGGASWNIQYESPAGLGTTYRAVQDLQVDPSDFNIQYAGVNGLGIIKSVDAGDTWSVSSDGIVEGVRFEVAVAPSDPNVVYTSTFSGSNTLLYYSNDKGESWVLADDPDYDTNFLGAQGWYDNTIAVNPYNPYEVFVGGVSIGKYLINPDNVQESERRFLGVDLEETAFLSFVNFEANSNGGVLDINTTSESVNPMTVEIRFGSDNVQKAHRFTVPEGSTSGVAANDYTYQDYVDVPFEVWDIENDRQLMVSFRDQEGDGEFNLNARSTTDDALSTAREYIYIHDIAYDASAGADISVNGGHEFNYMYFFWPVLSEGSVWDPALFQNSIMRIKYGTQLTAATEAEAVYDAYGSYEGQNQNNLHPDHHHLTMIKMDDAAETFMIVNGNDGGLGISTDNGDVISQITDGYVTTQFYGADKKPGEDKYIGGTQDNGTWVSTGNTVDETNAYNFVIGGDGFEVLWHPTNPDLVLGSIYNNLIRKSTNGGQSFSPSVNGITTEDGPFITRLAGSIDAPNTVYAIGANGVYKSTDFAGSWSMKTIDNSGWGGISSSSDVEVSQANSNIVWAGAGMSIESSTTPELSLFVSKDAGETFEVVNNYDPIPNAFYTGIYTHPTDENTAYALFSVANSPKILKTTDLGQTWEDISGFAGNNGVSDRGFPDVFVHSLLVMPFNTDIIWAGTEIGLYESLDGGLTWNIRNEIPSVSIWSMKIVDDQVVLGTHGRGIWTATIDDLAITTLKVSAFSYLGYGNAEVSVELPVVYDQVKVLVDDVEVGVLESPENGTGILSITEFYEFNGAEIQIIGVSNGTEYKSTIFAVEPIDVAPAILNYETSINGDVYPVTIEVENNEPFEKVEVLFDNQLVYTDTQTLTESAGNRVISFDYDKQETNSFQIKAYINDQVFTTEGESVIITSNNESLDNDIKVFPNPTASYINVSSNTISVDEIKIYSSNGVQVNKIDINSSAKNTQIDLSSLNKGVYLIQIVGQDGKMLTKRIIKE
ncbi:T9SS type A sorting domain-containing protein [Marivirga salinae]|uniref:T9SS type A sorting domain-containing protein n=1 Tax=Marivirga salinarum TaxID=3059078 RepID=A0AA49JB16_9BACT|nr:T9SS type A sorting domain-containing protein [Marivirga sp. BDSF4-3]WKK73459.2 T9SS type A sorting domain-containing protein [Marivirga sp. BDSF4-3]